MCLNVGKRPDNWFFDNCSIVCIYWRHKHPLFLCRKKFINNIISTSLKFNKNQGRTVSLCCDILENFRNIPSDLYDLLSVIYLSICLMLKLKEYTFTKKIFVQPHQVQCNLKSTYSNTFSSN